MSSPLTDTPGPLLSAAPYFQTEKGRIKFELGDLGYDRERTGSERHRLAALVAEADAEGIPPREIARLARVSRGTVLDLLEEPA